jgi:hypothetical protein
VLGLLESKEEMVTITVVCDRVCNSCQEEKPQFEFYRNRKGFYKYCKMCYVERNKGYQESYRIRNRFAIRVRACKARAKDKDLPFDLTEEHLREVWTGVCPIFNMPLDIQALKNSPQHAELDRVIPELGYVKGNVAWLSQRANRIKDNAKLEELERLVEWLKSKQNM